MTCSLASCLAMEPLMLFSPCDKYKRDTKQGRRNCAMFLWIGSRHLIWFGGMGVDMCFEEAGCAGVAHTHSYDSVYRVSTYFF